jgi:hypothetical protein
LKSVIAYLILKKITSGKVWQGNYYESVMKHEKESRLITLNNPLPEDIVQVDDAEGSSILIGYNEGGYRETLHD